MAEAGPDLSSVGFVVLQFSAAREGKEGTRKHSLPLPQRVRLGDLNIPVTSFCLPTHSVSD